MKSKRKLIVGSIAIIITGSLVWGFKYLYDFQSYRKIISTLTINPIKISVLKDGTYTGSFNAKLVAAKVSVNVSDGKITGIKLLKHTNGRGKNGEAVIEEVIRAQSLEVDAISGATNSSKVILKSLENALKP